MKKIINLLQQSLIVSVFILLLYGCNERQNITKSEKGRNWQDQFDQKLPLLGHRNWILIVDKAFPEQNAPGIEYIYAEDRLIPVLKQVMTKLQKSGHVKPIIYQDKELKFITDNQVKGIGQFTKDSKMIFGRSEVNTVLHDSIFKKLDTESKLFKVLVIKTNELMPYTSVFLQLDCAYWDNLKEKQLRERIKGF